MIGIIMGSDSDFEVMKAAVEVAKKFDVPYEVEVVSAHRTPERMVEYAKTAESRGVRIIIAGAGGAAHLPGMTASLTTVPVIGVPVSTKHLKGMDSLLSIVQMPRGIPVATVAIDNSENAALLAIRILALSDLSLSEKLKSYHTSLEEKVRHMNQGLKEGLFRDSSLRS